MENKMHFDIVVTSTVTFNNVDAYPVTTKNIFGKDFVKLNVYDRNAAKELWVRSNDILAVGWFTHDN